MQKTRQIDRVYRICYLYLKNEPDAYDAAHETFLRLIHKKPHFENEDHEKVWLIRVAVNICKDFLKSYWKKNWFGNVDPEFAKHQEEDTPNELLDLVLQLPEKYTTLVYLYYYEGYDIREIAEILKENPSTLRSRLSKAREMLRKELKADEKNFKKQF